MTIAPSRMPTAATDITHAIGSHDIPAALFAGIKELLKNYLPTRKEHIYSRIGKDCKPRKHVQDTFCNRQLIRDWIVIRIWFNSCHYRLYWKLTHLLINSVLMRVVIVNNVSPKRRNIDGYVHLTDFQSTIPDNKVHGTNMGPTWVLSAPDGPHVGSMNLAIRDLSSSTFHLYVHPSLTTRQSVTGFTYVASDIANKHVHC